MNKESPSSGDYNNGTDEVHLSDHFIGLIDQTGGFLGIALFMLTLLC